MNEAVKVADLKVSDSDFQSEVLESPVPVLVDFWAPWCGPCMAISPVVEELALAWQGRVMVRKLNVDENPETARKYGVRSIPMLALFRNGILQKSVVGVRSRTDLDHFIEQHLR